jgi:sortase (surface protein transpeptidase)
VGARRALLAAGIAVLAATAGCGDRPSISDASGHPTGPAPSASATPGQQSAPALQPVLPSLRPLEVGSRGVPAPAQGVGAGGPAPTRIEIPAIGVDAPLVRLDLNRDGTIQVPSDFASPGWYSRGPAPGAEGAAVILGHLDSHNGPAVFWRLSALQSGDVVRVAREDGSEVRFSIERTASYSVDAFPSFEVYGATSRPELRLVTCGGSYSSSRRQYLANVVAFASMSS